MRVYLKLSRSKSVVPYNHLPVLAGAIHKWLGPNELHGDVSLYSFSWINGGRQGHGGIYFPVGAGWFISAHEPGFLQKIMKGIYENPELNYGMRVAEIVIRPDPVFGPSEQFWLASPALIKRREGTDVRQYTYLDAESDRFMTETLQRKLRIAGLDPEGATVRFNRDYPAAKTKLVDYKNIKNKSSLCPVIIEGSPEQLAFAWNVGIGNSTGIGFGALK